jgi:hypothetical protein
MTSRYFGVLTFVVTSSCAAVVGVTRVTSSLPPREPGCQLRIFLAEKAVKRRYQVVCLIDARSGGNTIFSDHSASAAIDNARPKACECGADAIIVDSVGSGNPIDQGTAVVRAIKYLSDAERPGD